MLALTKFGHPNWGTPNYGTISYKSITSYPCVGHVTLVAKCCIAFVVAQSLSCVQLFATPWTAACQASLSFTISHRLFKLMSIESVIPPSRLILCPLLLLPSVFPSIKFFSNESALCGQSIGVSASASVLPMNIQD